MAHHASALNQLEDLQTWLDIMTSDILPGHAHQQQQGLDQLDQGMAKLKATPSKRSTETDYLFFFG